MSIRNILSKKANSSSEVNQASIVELINGYKKYTNFLTKTDIAKIEAVKETMKEYKYEEAENENISSSTKGGEVIRDLIGENEQEEVIVLSLNTKNDVIGIDRVFKGTLNSSMFHPREILRTVMSYPAARFIVGHNHPSGDLEPSEADINATERIVEAGELLGIECLDHFIVNKKENGYLSLREEGYM